MAERGTSEESQRTETSELPSLYGSGVLEHLAAIFEEAHAGSVTLRFRFRDEGAAAPDITVNLEADPAQASEASAKAHWKEEVAEALSRTAESQGGHAQRDNSYYEEVRRAVGRGAPSVLLGTSMKALDRNLQRIRPPDESSSPRRWYLVPSERSSIWWKLAVTGIWAFALLGTASVITTPSHGWFQLLGAITGLITWWVTAIVISVPRIRHGAKAWIRKKFFPDRSSRPTENESSSERRPWPVPPASPRK